jgi:hypothetical protein
MTYNTADVRPDFAAHIQQLARLFWVRNPKDRAAAAAKITEWFETQLLQRTDIAVTEPGLAAALAERRREVAETGTATTMYTPPLFNSLTYDQILGLYEQLRHLRTIGGREGSIKQAEWAEGRTKLAGQLEADPRPPVDAPAHVSSTQKYEDWARTFGNDQLNLRVLIRFLDNFDENGQFYQQIYTKILDAQSTKVGLRRKSNELFSAEIKTLDALTLRKDGKFKPTSTLLTQTKADGTTWALDEEERVFLAANWGNEYNRTAIREGYNVTDADVIAMIATLTPEQAKLVNTLWKMNESQWDQLATASHEVYGYVPTKTVALPFTVGNLEFTGGHMSLQYKERADTAEYLNGDDTTFFTTGMAPGKTSAIFDRLGSGKRQPILGKQTFLRTLDDNQHFIAYGVVGQQIQQLLGNKKMQNAIAAKHGMPFLKSLNFSVQGMTTNRKEKEASDAVAAISRTVRRATMVGALGYNLRNVGQQVTSLPIVAHEVGYGPYFEQLFSIYGKDTARKLKFIHARSEMMAARATLVNRESAEILREIAVPGGKMGRWYYLYNKHGFSLQAMADAFIAYPAWMARYQSEMAAHGDERRASRSADVMIGETVGSGDDIFLANFYRSNRAEHIRSLTQMGSWANMYMNRVATKSKGGREKWKPESLIAALLIPVMVSVVSAAIALDGPDDEESWVDWLKWAGSNYAGFAASWFPFVRDIAAAVKYRKAPQAGYAPIVELSAEAVTTLNEIIDSERDVNITGRGIFQTLTSVLPVAGANTGLRIDDYVNSYNQGQETPIEGPLTLGKAVFQSTLEGRNREE